MCHPFTYAAQELTQQVVSQTVLIEQGDDWLKLKSGEVIKGELTGTVKEEANSFDQEIEFDSDDLGQQEIEIEDIDILQTASFFTIRTTSGEIFDGYLSIQNQRLYLLNNGQQRSFPVEQVVSIYRGAEEDSGHWETELFLGLDISKGNTDEFFAFWEKLRRKETTLNRERNLRLATRIPRVKMKPSLITPRLMAPMTST
ncbi:hypothetical protein QW180_07155 [Vibrio sinaloensis]|nr:hypothetical protein [Vibrio sinaloensis]